MTGPLIRLLDSSSSLINFRHNHVAEILNIGEAVTFCNKNSSPDYNLLAKVEIKNEAQVGVRKSL